MHPIGFSTGALAYSDFLQALRMLAGKPFDAVELSALRLEELAPLVDALATLDLTQYRHVSVHAPSSYPEEAEPEVIGLLRECAGRGWPVVVHPDAIWSRENWDGFGGLLCLENMDKRKPIGRTVPELARLFDWFPEAGFCFDIAHARQVDTTMLEAYSILRAFGGRLRQIHISEVSSRSRHDRLSWSSIRAYQEVARYIPAHVPVIIEAPVREEELGREADRALEALSARPVLVGA